MLLSCTKQYTERIAIHYIVGGKRLTKMAQHAPNRTDATFSFFVIKSTKPATFSSCGTTPICAASWRNVFSTSSRTATSEEAAISTVPSLVLLNSSTVRRVLLLRRTCKIRALTIRPVAGRTLGEAGAPGCACLCVVRQLPLQEVMPSSKAPKNNGGKTPRGRRRKRKCSLVSTPSWPMSLGVIARSCVAHSAHLGFCLRSCLNSTPETLSSMISHDHTLPSHLFFFGLRLRLHRARGFRRQALQDPCWRAGCKSTQGSSGTTF